jgi:alkenylglycerophosphocholine hydrolase
MNLLLLLAAISAGMAIAAEERAGGRHRAFFLLKPLTTVLILAAAMLAPDADPTYRLWVTVALALSTAGDIALMFEGNGAFLAGLGSFLAAHVLFVVAFLAGTGWAMPSAWALLPGIVGAAFFVWLLPRTGPLLPAVLVYGLALMGMMLTASGREVMRGDASGWLAFVGASIFIVSDSALAIRKFVGPYPKAQFVILFTYWLAVGLIAASVAQSSIALGVAGPAP